MAAQARRYVESERTWAQQRRALPGRLRGASGRGAAPCGQRGRGTDPCAAYTAFSTSMANRCSGNAFGDGSGHPPSRARRRGHARRRAAAIGMRRLSIIDLAGGHQPLTNEDGTLWLVVQRRDLQLPRAARRAAWPAGPSFPHRLRLRDAAAPVRAARRRFRRAPQRHVRVRAVGSRRRRLLLSAATASAIKPLYLLQRRQAPRVRQRGEGDARSCPA